MVTVIEILTGLFKEALDKLHLPLDGELAITPSTKPEFGDYQVNGVMKLAKQLRVNPRELASKVVAVLSTGDVIARAEVAGPGFINITLSDDYLATEIGAKKLLKSVLKKKSTVVIDYSSPNLAKEMHVGHLRSTIIGDALVRLYQFCGYTVIKRNHVGDWGTQFGMLLAALKEEDAIDSELALSDLEGFYRKAKRRFDEDPLFAEKSRNLVVKLQAGDPEILKIWQRFVAISLGHCRKIYERLGVKLTDEDAVGESAYNYLLPQIVADLMQKKIAVVSDGTKCIFFTAEELPEGNNTPFIIQKHDGGYLYATTDLAAAYDRICNLHADLLLYVIDARQSLHLAQLFATVKKAAWADFIPKMKHVAFGTMLGADNKPFKTRDGGTVKLSTLLDEAVVRASKIIEEHHPDWSKDEVLKIAEPLGMAAVKYADLSKNRISDYQFNLDQMLALDGNTAPYLLYAYVRLKKIFSKNQLLEQEFYELPIKITVPIERQLALYLLRFWPMIDSARRENSPHLICNYLYELAGLCMRFYERCPILGENNAVKNSRLSLVAVVLRLFTIGFDLLGIKPIEQM